MSKSFDDLLAKVSQCSRKTVSVAVAQDAPILEAVKAAKEKESQMLYLWVTRQRSERSQIRSVWILQVMRS